MIIEKLEAENERYKQSQKGYQNKIEELLEKTENERCNKQAEQKKSSVESGSTSTIAKEEDSEKEDKDNDRDDGWGTIDLFYGNQKINNRGRTSDSQCQQDKLVAGLLGNYTGGYFLDMAANNAFRLSNTYELELLYDWKGICVEPNPGYWSGLVKRNCHVAAAVVGNERGKEVHFQMFQDQEGLAASGGIQDFMSKELQNKTTQKKPPKLPMVPIGEILQKYDAPPIMEYLSLDIEGAETMVMKDFPFDRYIFKIMTIERPDQELVDLLYKMGYVYLGGNNDYGEETAFVYKEFWNDLDLNALDKVGWIDYRNSTKWLRVNNDNNNNNDDDDNKFLPPTVQGSHDSPL